MRHVFPLLTLFAAGCIVYPDDTKDDSARMGAMTLCNAAKSQESKTGERVKELNELVPFLDGGETALIDPWGQKFQFEYVEVEPEKSRLMVFTTEPKTGQRIGWPRHLAEKK